MQFPWYFKKSNNSCCYMAEMLPIQRAAKTHLSIDHKVINHISKSDGDYLLTLTRFLLVFLLLLFFQSFTCHTRVFNYGDVAITVEGLQNVTYTQHSWPLSIEDSLANHTYCDTAHPFKMVIFEDPLHSHLLPSVWQWS